MTWREQREWREIQENLQYAALQECMGAVIGARKESVQKLAASGSIEGFVRPSAVSFLARTFCDSHSAGVAINSDWAFMEAC